MILLPRFTPSSVQSISGVGKPLRQQMNWSDELYITDWFLSSVLISGGPGHRIHKCNSKKVKVQKKKKKKKRQKIRRATEENKIKSTFTCDCNMKSWFTFPFTVFSAAFILTSIFITHSINCESVVVTAINPILSPQYLRCRETAQRANELKRRVIGNRLILELSINFRRTWA